MVSPRTSGVMIEDAVPARRPAARQGPAKNRANQRARPAVAVRMPLIVTWSLAACQVMENWWARRRMHSDGTNSEAPRPYASRGASSSTQRSTFTDGQPKPLLARTRPSPRREAGHYSISCEGAGLKDLFHRPAIYRHGLARRRLHLHLFVGELYRLLLSAAFSGASFQSRMDARNLGVMQGDGVVHDGLAFLLAHQFDGDLRQNFIVLEGAL